MIQKHLMELEKLGFTMEKELKIYLTATINWDSMYDFESLGEDDMAWDVRHIEGVSIEKVKHLN